MDEKEVITFIENYCLINGDDRIKLNNFQKAFIKWMSKNRHKNILCK